MTNSLSLEINPLGKKLRRAWMVALLVSLALLAFGVILQIAIGGRPSVDAWLGRALGAVGVLPLACVTGLIASSVICRHQLPVYMTLAMVLSIVATVGWMWQIWTVFTPGVRIDEMSSRWPRLWASFTIGGVGLAAGGYLLTSPRQQRPLPLLRATVFVSGVVLTFAINALMWSLVLQRFGIVVLAMLVVSGIGLVGSSTALLVTGRVLQARAKSRTESLPSRVAMTLVCPDCQCEQTVRTGPARCEQCGLAMLVDVEEPRCECGYLLFQLAGDTCPECGRTSPRARRRATLSDPVPPPSADAPVEAVGDALESPHADETI